MLRFRNLAIFGCENHANSLVLKKEICTKTWIKVHAENVLKYKIKNTITVFENTMTRPTLEWLPLLGTTVFKDDITWNLSATIQDLV